MQGLFATFSIKWPQLLFAFDISTEFARNGPPTTVAKHFRVFGDHTLSSDAQVCIGPQDQAFDSIRTAMDTTIRPIPSDLISHYFINPHMVSD